jgi:hypothetical protein
MGGGAVRRFQRGLAVAAAAAVPLLALTPLSPTQPAAAAVPAPTASTAVVHLAVGAERATAQTLAPLAGVRFGLFADQPAAVGPSGVTTQPPAYTCVSDADGDCAVSVPVGAGGVTPGTRLWAAPTALPAGWSTAPDPSQDFRTAPLYAGRDVQVYGVWPLTRADPRLAPGCGHTVAVVTGSKPGTAVADLAEALRGTPSRVAWYGAAGATDAMPVASTGDAKRLTALVASGGSRGWRASLDALAAADRPPGSAGHLDLAVVTATTDVTGAEANRLQGLGTRVVAETDVAALRGPLLAGCTGSLTVVSPGAPITVTTSTGASGSTDAVTGAVALPLAGAGPVTVTLPYAPTAARCLDLGSGAAVPATLTGGALALTTSVGAALSCTLPRPADGSATLTVAHRWSVTTATGTKTYADGTQPADLRSSLTVAGTPQPWGTPRRGLPAGQPVAVVDTPAIGLPGCSLASTTLAGAGALTGTLTPGSWTLTEHVTCHSHLTLAATVLGGDAQPGDWSLQAAPGGPSGASGTAGATGEVPSGRKLTLTQAGGPATYTLMRTDCAITSGGQRAIGYDAGTAGSLSVPLGQDVTCTFANATASLTLASTVDGAASTTTTWPLTATPTKHQAGLSAASVTGRGTVLVRPGLAYTVAQGKGPAGYQLTGIACTVDGVAITGPLTIPPGSGAACTADNTLSQWTASQRSDPASGSRVSPGAVITYTLTASHLRGQATTHVLIGDDLAQVLDHGSLIDGAISTTAGTARLDGTTVTWRIPQLSDSATATFRIRVAERTDGSQLVGTLTTLTTTEPGGAGDPAVPCAQTDLAQTVTGDTDHRAATRCDAVVHRTYVAGGPDSRHLGLVIGGALLVAVLGTLTAAIASRRRTLKG